MNRTAYTRVRTSLITALLLLGGALLLLPQTSLHAREEFQEVQLRLAWENVEGNQGYVVEIKEDGAGDIKQHKVKTNNIVFQLKPGHYQIRVAALNKFGKPALWTEWNPIHVTGRQKVQEFKAEKEAPARSKSKYTFFRPTYLVPGLPRLRRSLKDPVGYVWPVVLTGLGYYTWQEIEAGNRLAEDKLNDPLFLSALLNKQPLTLIPLFQDRRDSRQVLYDKHVKNQTIAGGLFVLLYLAHYAESVYLSGHPPAAPKAGETSLQLDLSPAPLVSQGEGTPMRWEDRVGLRFTLHF